MVRRGRVANSGVHPSPEQFGSPGGWNESKAQVIEFNPQAALQKQILADGFVPNSPEFEIESGGIWYVAQRAEHLGTGEVREYHVPKGDWEQVAHIQRGEGDEILYT